MCKAINEMIEKEVRKRLFEKNEQIKKMDQRLLKINKQTKKKHTKIQKQLQITQLEHTNWIINMFAEGINPERIAVIMNMSFQEIQDILAPVTNSDNHF